MDIVQQSPYSTAKSEASLSSSEQRIQHLQQAQFLIKSRLSSAHKLRSGKINITKIRDILQEHTRESFENMVSPKFLENILEKIQKELRDTSLEETTATAPQLIHRKRNRKEERESEATAESPEIGRRISHRPATTPALIEQAVDTFKEQAQKALLPYANSDQLLQKISSCDSLDTLQSMLEDQIQHSPSELRSEHIRQTLQDLINVLLFQKLQINKAQHLPPPPKVQEKICDDAFLSFLALGSEERVVSLLHAYTSPERKRHMEELCQQFLQNCKETNAPTKTLVFLRMIPLIENPQDQALIFSNLFSLYQQDPTTFSAYSNTFEALLLEKITNLKKQYKIDELSQVVEALPQSSFREKFLSLICDSCQNKENALELLDSCWIRYKAQTASSNPTESIETVTIEIANRLSQATPIFSDGYSIITYYVHIRDAKFVQFLIEKAHLDINGIDGADTPLTQAIHDKNFKMAQLLLSLGANPQGFDRTHVLPYYWARHVLSQIEQQPTQSDGSINPWVEILEKLRPPSQFDESILPKIRSIHDAVLTGSITSIEKTPLSGIHATPIDVHKTLGSGTFKLVLRAVENIDLREQMSTQVAIAQLKKGQDSFELQFESSIADALRAVPHTLPVTTRLITDRSTAFAYVNFMKLCNQGTLTDFFTKTENTVTRLKVANQLIEWVAGLHATGLMDPDLKSDNALVDQKPGDPPQLFSADFGAILTPMKPDRWQERGICATFPAPELYPSYHGEEDPRSIHPSMDCWVLGDILYHAKFGDSLLQYFNLDWSPDPSLWKRSLDAMQQSLAKLAADGDELDQLIAQLLSVDPGNRPTAQNAFDRASQYITEQELLQTQKGEDHSLDLDIASPLAHH